MVHMLGLFCFALLLVPAWFGLVACFAFLFIYKYFPLSLNEFKRMANSIVGKWQSNAIRCQSPTSMTMPHCTSFVSRVYMRVRAYFKSIVLITTVYKYLRK